MKYLLICFFLFNGSAVLAQDTPKFNIYTSSLSVGDILEFNNRSLKFKNVVSDSRCPENVTCVWAGEAKVAVEIYEDGKCITEQIISVQSSNIPLEFSVGNMIYSIRSLSLSPYPTVRKSDMPINYVLQMSVRETLDI